VAELAFPDPPLADAVVLLRPWREADVPGKLMAFSDPVIQRFSWPRTTPYSEADAHEYFAAQQQARQRGEELNFAFVEPRDEDDVLGGGSLYEIDLQRACAAVGYWLAPAARGRGVASHAVGLLARWAFDELDVARLELTCGPDNLASQRVAERCGFVREGVLRSHLPFKGSRRDTVVFSLLPGELRDSAMRTETGQAANAVALSRTSQQRAEWCIASCHHLPSLRHTTA
jgi:RimJ/RimL family protein N-acetyltransferase